MLFWIFFAFIRFLKIMFALKFSKRICIISWDSSVICYIYFKFDGMICKSIWIALRKLTFSLALPRDQSGHFELSISLNSCILIFCSNYSHNYASYLIDLIFRFYSNLLLSNHALNHRVLVVSNAFHLIRLFLIQHVCAYSMIIQL